jgi:hypothetical protein
MSAASERRRADEAKARLDGTVAELKQRLAPATLAEEAKAGGLRFARTKPGMAAAAGLVMALWVLRGPLARLIRPRRRATAADGTSYIEAAGASQPR